MGSREIVDSNGRYRLGYSVISTFLVLLTFLVPETFLWTHDDSILPSRISVVAMYFLSGASFYILQGSDPGYIDSECESSDPGNIDEYLEYPHHCTDTNSFLGSNIVEADSDILNSAKNINETDALLSADTLTLTQVSRKKGFESISYDYRPGGPSGLLTVANDKFPDGKFVDRVKDKKRRYGKRNPVSLDSRRGKSKSYQIVSNNGDNEDSDECSDNELYCKYCDISVPRRSHHCNYCQRCVATFDHHCFVIGTCIGERNHCRFYTFLLINFVGIWCLSVIVDSAFIDVTSTENSSTNVTDTGLVYNRRPSNHTELAYITSAFLGIIWWYALLLIFYQTWLVMTSTTGYECIKSNNASTGEDFEACDPPYGGQNVYHKFYSFCCLRDGIFSDLKGIPWRYSVWKKPAPRPNQNDVQFQDNFWRNRHYSCC